MTAAIMPPSDALRRAQSAQRAAAAPDRSVWVAASAGSGKTRVLTERVLTLLLRGTLPSRILCLTFTRAAAAEMATRLRDELAAWAVVPHKAAQVLGRDATAEELALAQRLFATVLDAPGGLRIQTLHGFCESLLGRFPIEANIPPHFEVIDERTARETLRAARDAVLRRARNGGEPTLADALAQVTAWISEDEFAELFADLARGRGRIARLLDSKDGPQGAAEAVYALLGVRVDETEAVAVTSACADAAFQAGALRAAAKALMAGSASDRARGEAIAAWLAAPDARATGFYRYAETYFTEKGQVLKTLITKQAAKAAPDAPDVLLREAERLHTVLARCRSIRLAQATAAMLRLGDALLKEYAARKEAAAQLDYDDLVLKTRALLAVASDAQWVLYKLDNGIDHILIDEAQDTSPDQWAVVGALATEFFTGRGERTVFAVGDGKQSIFSFQGADPEGFERMRDHFASHASEARAAWENIDLDVSFRSVPAVLAAVDAVFAQPEAAEGVVAAGETLRHLAHREGEPGLVELWPCAPAAVKDQPAPWRPPPVRRETSAEARLAKLIAARIKRWIDGGDVLPSTGTAIRRKDIMVLVARRTPFVEHLVRELKARHVAVAGVDRMVLTEQLPVMDLIALGNALLLPEDDLNLAAVLKGPLFGLTEEDLFTLCHGRDGSVWQALQQPAFAAERAELAELMARADYVPPYELFAGILGGVRGEDPRTGRQKIVARLGYEANDPLDEFLAQALAYERTHPPSLQGFLDWLVRGDQEVKRDLEQGGRDEVRIITVHGAKGLQAPVVILPDTMHVPQDRTRILWTEDEDGPFLWTPRREVEDETAARLRATVRAAQERERRRLLYVAMTRAQDRLYICGWENKKAAPSGCWHKLIEAGLASVAERVPFDFTADIGPTDGWRGDGLRLSQPGRIREAQPPAETTPTPPLPAFAHAKAPHERAAAALAPSRLDADAPPARSPLADDGARARGRAIHTLLQHLPGVPAERRAAAAARLIARYAPELVRDAADEIARAICHLIAAPDFAPLFGPDSLAEVPIVGRIGETVIAGQVDRLVVAPDRVLIVDYKSGEPPRSAADTPRAYVRQLAAYRAVLAAIYPGRDIACAILWTAVPELAPIAAEILDSHAP